MAATRLIVRSAKYAEPSNDEPGSLIAHLHFGGAEFEVEALDSIGVRQCGLFNPGARITIELPLAPVQSKPE